MYEPDGCFIKIKLDRDRIKLLKVSLACHSQDSECLGWNFVVSIETLYRCSVYWRFYLPGYVPSDCLLLHQRLLDSGLPFLKLYNILTLLVFLP